MNTRQNTFQMLPKQCLFSLCGEDEEGTVRDAGPHVPEWKKSRSSDGFNLDYESTGNGERNLLRKTRETPDLQATTCPLLSHTPHPRRRCLRGPFPCASMPVPVFLSHQLCPTDYGNPQIFPCLFLDAAVQTNFLLAYDFNARAGNMMTLTAEQYGLCSTKAQSSFFNCMEET